MLKEDIIDLIVAKVVSELKKEVKKQAPTGKEISMEGLVEEIEKLRYLLEMIFFSNRDNLYAIARSMGLGTEIYFAAESGWLQPNGGSAQWVYLVPERYVDIAESLGYDPSSARTITFRWTRDGKLIYEDPLVVRRDFVRVYQFSDEAYNYCRIEVINQDSVNEQAIHVWGYCHFIYKPFYGLIKRRMTETYPIRLFAELDKIKRELKV